MHPSRLALLRLLPLILVASPAPAQAPSRAAAPTDFVDGPVGLTPAQASHFKAALDALAQQGHTCIVAEDAPLRPTLDSQVAPAIPDHTPLSAAVTLVANAYDYDVVRTGNVFTLTKRYTDPADLPDVTIEECAEDIHNVVVALETYDPPHASSGIQGLSEPFYQMTAILNGLSPEQKGAVFSKQGLPVAALGGDAHAALDRWNLGIYLDGALNNASGYELRMARAPKASVGMFVRGTADENSTMDYSKAPTVFGKREPDGQGGTGFTIFAHSTRGSQDPSGGPVTPEELAAARARRTQRKADGHEALAQVVAALAARGTRCQVNPALAARGTRCQVNPALAAKAVTVAGEADAPPDAVLAGLALVYGLRARHRQSDDTEVLDLPERRSPVDVAAVGGDVLALLPAPLLRASHLLDQYTSQARMDEGMGRLQDLARQGRQGDAAYKALLDERHRLRAQASAQGDRAPAVQFAAVRALRVAAELYPASAKVDGLLPVAAMTAEDRAAYADAVLLPFLSQIPEMMDSRHLKYLTEEDQYVLTASIYSQPDSRGTWKMGLYLNTPQPDGQLSMAIGMNNAMYLGVPPPDEVASSVAASSPATAPPSP